MRKLREIETHLQTPLSLADTLAAGANAFEAIRVAARAAVPSWPGRAVRCNQDY